MRSRNGMRTLQYATREDKFAKTCANILGSKLNLCFHPINTKKANDKRSIRVPTVVLGRDHGFLYTLCERSVRWRRRISVHYFTMQRNASARCRDIRHWNGYSHLLYVKQCFWWIWKNNDKCCCILNLYSMRPRFTINWQYNKIVHGLRTLPTFGEEKKWKNENKHWDGKEMKW